MTKSKTCTLPTCNRTTIRGEKYCPEHNHITALQAEIERLATFTPVHIATLKANYGPELETLLVALTRLVNEADPLRSPIWDRSSPTTRQPDKWAGDSQLDEVHNTVTHKGAAQTHHPRQLWSHYQKELGRLADRILGDLDPTLRRKGPEKPRCQQPGCRWRGRVQTIGARLCGWCGEELTVKEKAEVRS